MKLYIFPKEKMFLFGGSLQRSSYNVSTHLPLVYEIRELIYNIVVKWVWTWHEVDWPSYTILEFKGECINLELKIISF